MQRLALATADIQDFGAVSARTVVAGVEAVCDPLGALYLPESRLLVVSDLHLEKGAAFARRGMMLPPYDTLATLKVLEAVIARHDPAIVPGFDDSLTLEHGQLSLELIAQPLVRVRVGEEQRCHGSPLCWGGFNVPPLFLQGQRARFSQATDRSWFTVRRR